jgi:choline dehydrogenase-like flavoprotein
VVAGQQDARFPARVSHRDRRRPPDAGRGLHREHPHLHGRRGIGTPISFGGYGKSLKRDYRRLYGSTVSFAGRGEMVPNADTYLELDPRVVDKWGIPVLRFHFKWSDYEIKQAKHMQETFRGIIQEMGGTPMSPMPTAAENYDLADGGRIIHELGVTRMGNDPSSSVLNKNCQAHDAKNVFVATAGRSYRRRTRIAPGPSSRSRCERANSSPTSGNGAPL